MTVRSAGILCSVGVTLVSVLVISASVTSGLVWDLLTSHKDDDARWALVYSSFVLLRKIKTLLAVIQISELRVFRYLQILDCQKNIHYTLEGKVGTFYWFQFI